MWKDGNHTKIEDINAWMLLHIMSGEFEAISFGCDADQKRSKITFTRTIVLDYTANRGSIFAWVNETERVWKISVADKLLSEAQKIIDLMNGSNIDSMIAKFGMSKSAHIDVNTNPIHKSNQTLKAIKGWIEGYGYKVVTKPDSFASCSVADRMARLKTKKKKSKQEKHA